MIFPQITIWEMIIVLGSLFLSTRYKFVSWCDMWYSRSQCKYIKPPGIVKIGLTRPMFNHMWSCIWFSRQKQPNMDRMNMRKWEWQLVNGHIEEFNNYRLEWFYPSERLCVDDIFSRWYGLGGYLVNLGLSQYVQMDCKPADGFKI